MIHSLTPLVPFGSLVVAAGAWSMVALLFLGRRGRRPGVLRPVAAVAVAIVASAVFFESVRPATLDAHSLPIAVRSHVTDRAAITDAGGVVPLDRLADSIARGEIPDGFEGEVIVADGADARSNCHGWVFTGGRYCVPGASVDAILSDNGYAREDVPRPGDLVVYRDDDGEPVHTGVVKAIGEGGFVLVESKWGQLDVFWHTVDTRAYGTRFDYWRSARDGHLLRLVSGPSAALRGARGTDAARGEGPMRN